MELATPLGKNSFIVLRKTLNCQLDCGKFVVWQLAWMCVSKVSDSNDKYD